MASLKKKRRIRMLAFGGVALAASAAIAGFAFNDSIVFFFPPTELIAKAETGEAGPDRRVRLGGMVAEGSVAKVDGGASVSFDVTDGETTLPVIFAGVLPDLFREGQGVVAEGYYRNAVFEAETILAKHDENYMPREIADALKESGDWKPEHGVIE